MTFVYPCKQHMSHHVCIWHSIPTYSGLLYNPDFSNIESNQNCKLTSLWISNIFIHNAQWWAVIRFILVFVQVNPWLSSIQCVCKTFQTTLVDLTGLKICSLILIFTCLWQCILLHVYPESTCQYYSKWDFFFFWENKAWHFMWIVLSRWFTWNTQSWFGRKNVLSGLIWMQIVWYSDGIPERYFWKS